MKKVIALVGPIASGKGVVAGYLEDKGYCSFSLSDRIREELTRQGMEITRSNLRDMAHKLRKDLGPDILAKRTADKAKKSGCEKIVIDAIRNPFEVRRIQEDLDAVVIGVNASQKRRYEFMQMRSRPGDIKTYDEFIKQDNEELASGVDHKMNILDAIKKADYIIENDGTLEDLKSKVDDILKKLATA